MKKPIFILLLLCSSLLSFPQQEISNESHPFQVLFVDSASYIGKQESVKPYDFFSKYDLIRNSGELVLLHYSGVVLEIREKILNVREFSKDRETHEYIERPIISDPEKFDNKSLDRRINATGSAIVCGPRDEISFTYPYSLRFETPTIYINETLHLCWNSNEGNRKKFIVLFKNLFDEIILTDTVQSTSSSIEVKKLVTDEGLLIVKVIGANNPDIKSYDIGFRINMNTRTQNNAPKYDLLMDALQLSYSREPMTANELYKISIESSNQDPRFIKLYEDFLNRNPEFRQKAE